MNPGEWQPQGEDRIKEKLDPGEHLYAPEMNQFFLNDDHFWDGYNQHGGTLEKRFGTHDAKIVWLRNKVKAVTDKALDDYRDLQYRGFNDKEHEKALVNKAGHDLERLGARLEVVDNSDLAFDAYAIESVVRGWPERGFRYSQAMQDCHFIAGHELYYTDKNLDYREW